MEQDTVNPALLFSNNNEKETATSIHDDIPESGAQENVWSGPPVYAREPSQPTVSFGQETQIPGPTGFENLFWTGDLSYSSYGSSPADNGFGWQHLVHRFGEQNLAMSPSEGFDSASISRNVSFSTAEQYPFHSASALGRPGDEKQRQTKSRRGRVFADMSVSGTETVFEDSDSHHSWTAADNMEHWCACFRERLLDFRRHKDQVSIITSPLQTRQRRKVHSMANLWGLSHMSIGSDRNKRMLISKCELTPSTSEKRWNPTRSNWSPGLVDPRVVIFDFISLQLSSGRIQQCLREAGLPVPIRLTIDYNTKTSPMPQYATVYAMFTHVEEAMDAILALDGSRPNWNGIDANIESDFVHFPPGFDLSDTTLEAFDHLPDLIRTEKHRFHQQRALLKSTNTYVSETDGEDGYLTSDEITYAKSHRSNSKTPRQKYFRKPSDESSQPGYNSNNSLPSDSETSTFKKRKRVPKIPGGYTCSFEDCHRVFDRDGDRRKHEKNHTATRPHVCIVCGKGFLFPKDLKRHIKGVHEGGGAGSVSGTEGDGGIGITQPVPISPMRQDQFKRLYQTKPISRGASKLSSSYS